MYMYICYMYDYHKLHRVIIFIKREDHHTDLEVCIQDEVLHEWFSPSQNISAVVTSKLLIVHTTCSFYNFEWQTMQAIREASKINTTEIYRALSLCCPRYACSPQVLSQYHTSRLVLCLKLFASYHLPY